MTLEQKAAQMLQPAALKATHIAMKKYGYGSICPPTVVWTGRHQAGRILYCVRRRLSSESGIPFIYGTDAVHGNQGCLGAVIFPHNIGIGAANHEELTYRMGRLLPKR